MKNNGNPIPVFETDERNIHFIATLPIHPLFTNEEAPQNEPQNEPQKLIAQLTPRQQQIIALIRKNNCLSRQEMADKLDIAYSTIKRDLSAISHIVKYIGASKGGHWEIIE